MAVVAGPVVVATEQNMVTVKCLITEDPRMTENETKDSLNLGSDPPSSLGCTEALRPLGAPPADRGTDGAVPSFTRFDNLTEQVRAGLGHRHG